MTYIYREDVDSVSFRTEPGFVWFRTGSQYYRVTRFEFAKLVEEGQVQL